MADNIYLLETRLSRAQQTALDLVRDVARQNGLTVFLVGGAVRDLISGTAVRDLDVAVQGDVRTLRKELETVGAVVVGQSDFWQSLFLALPGGVRLEVSSTLSVTYPKPGKPVVAPATILEDLRRRDFTANAMALSLNEGSYGLLMDPLNGVADIENRQLRLVSNYGFIEDPALILRAARFMGRLGWTLEEKTQARYETSREDEYIKALDGFHRGYETEELFHEEDPLRVMRRLEEEGWLSFLSPALSSAKVNAAELQRLREVQSQLQLQGVTPNAAALSFPLLTAKLSAEEVQNLKKSFPRQGFVAEIEALDAAGKEFASQLISKAVAQPSQAYQLIRNTSPEAVLWAAFYSKNANVQAKFKSFSTDWPQARQRLPYPLLQEMRISPDLPGYDDLLEKLFFELMDGRLDTSEAMKAFLEPYSPPAPPPPVSLRRARTSKKDSKPSRSRKKAQAADSEAEGDSDQLVTPDIEPQTVAVEPEQAQASSIAPDVVPEAAPAPKPEPTTTLEKAASERSAKTPRKQPASPAVQISVPPSPAKEPAASRPAAPSSATRVAAKSPAQRSVAAKSPSKQSAPKRPEAKTSLKRATTPPAKPVKAKAASSKSVPPTKKLVPKKQPPTKKPVPAPSKNASVSAKRASSPAGGKKQTKASPPKSVTVKRSR